MRVQTRSLRRRRRVRLEGGLYAAVMLLGMGFDSKNWVDWQLNGIDWCW
jgi:hypothetical protein